MTQHWKSIRITPQPIFTKDPRSCSRDALSPLQIALRVSPKDPLAAGMRFTLCHAHLQLREYAEAIEECRRSINLNKEYWYAYPDLIVAYEATGQALQARQ